MFKKYMHIERLGSDKVTGILNGECYVFPKLDGTNASVWVEAELCAGSRNRQLTLEKDNAGFYAWVREQSEAFGEFFADYPDLRLYGEWLVPHTLRTYRREAWREFYIFEVYDDLDERYLPYSEYADLTAALPFPTIAPLEIVVNPTREHLLGLVNRNTYLIEDGNGTGEGIVIKRYDFENQWGETVWAKIVRNEYKERNLEAFGTPTVAMKGNLELQLAGEYVTRGRIEKTLAKMRDSGPVTRRRIPELFGRVWHDVIEEELWDILKQHKNPTLNFNEFYQATLEEIKRNCPELFG